MTDYEKLENLYNEIDVLIAMQVTTDDEEFKTWELKSQRFLSKKYGKDSSEVENFNEILFIPRMYPFEVDHFYFVSVCKEGLLTAKSAFAVYLEEMQEEIQENLSKTTLPKQQIDVKTQEYSKVFIVHGHDSGLKHEVARVIEKQGLTAILLSEQVNGGMTVIEKIEANSDVSAAICLFTSDDEAKANNDCIYTKRARQNVVLETGYFMAKLGRENIVILAEKDLELPSDLQGVMYTDTTNWQFSILKELKKIGYMIDYNKIDG